MKKLLLALLVALLTVSVVFALNACGNGEETTAETTTEASETTTLPETSTTAAATEAEIPEGYAVYDNGDISFAYPENFVKTDGDTVIFAGANGNNITFVFEEKNPYYASMDLAAFNRDMKPAFEAMGLSISNASVAQTQNGAGLAITKVAYTATVEGVSMKQTQYIITVGEKTYVVTVTEVTADAALVTNVFNTLAAAK